MIKQLAIGLAFLIIAEVIFMSIFGVTFNDLVEVYNQEGLGALSSRL